MFLICSTSYCLVTASGIYGMCICMYVIQTFVLVYFSVIKNMWSFIIVAADSAMSVKLLYGGQSPKNSTTPTCPEMVFHFAFLRWVIIPYKLLLHVSTSSEVNLQRRAEIGKSRQWHTQEFCSGGGSKNSVEDREKGDLGSGSPLVRGSVGSCNLVQ